MPAIAYYLLDTFSVRPFSGNPAAVLVLPSRMDDFWLQNVARETNQPVTAFLMASNDGFDLRWFAATGELELCGHGTLAAGQVLRDRGVLSAAAEANFSTRSGTLKAKARDEGIELDFPLVRESPADPPAGMIDALGVKPDYVCRSRYDYLVAVASEAVLREIKPDFAALARMPTRGVIVTTASDSQQYDFVSRFFAPSTGVDEDAVTGSAHCTLAAYWSKKLGKNSFRAYQASMRGGEIRVEVHGERVRIAGRCVIVARGEFRQP